MQLPGNVKFGVSFCFQSAGLVSAISHHKAKQAGGFRGPDVKMFSSVLFVPKKYLDKINSRKQTKKLKHVIWY